MQRMLGWKSSTRQLQYTTGPSNAEQGRSVNPVSYPKLYSNCRPVSAWARRLSSRACIPLATHHTSHQTRTWIAAVILAMAFLTHEVPLILASGPTENHAVSEVHIDARPPGAARTEQLGGHTHHGPEAPMHTVGCGEIGRTVSSGQHNQEEPPTHASLPSSERRCCSPRQGYAWVSLRPTRPPSIQRALLQVYRI